MPARVMVVHDRPELSGRLTAALSYARGDGVYRPIAALDALDPSQQRLEVLVTGIRFLAE
jgi:hypothetical protein